MSKTVYRYDRGSLRRPEVMPQGFLRVDGHPARAGIYEYRRADGTVQRELRPHDEVLNADSLASYDAAPITVEHPADGEVNADNVRRHEVGTVSGPGRADGDHVATTQVIKDARAIKLVKAGKQELSPGYKIELDETPGADPRYGYPGNPAGRYDAVQRKIRVNHLALVDRARGGSTVRLRMDSAERVDGAGKLTTEVNGHQHLVNMAGWDGAPQFSGETSCAMSEGADNGHEHPWVKAADGTVTIGMADGHTHEIVDGGMASMASSGVQFDRATPALESGRMDKDEQIRSLKEQLAAAEAKLVPVTTAATQNTSRADAAEATIVTLRGENDALRAQIAAAAQVVETEAIKREKVRADAAEVALRERNDSFDAAVENRVALEREAAVVMPDLNVRRMSDRAVIATVVKRLDAQQDISSGVSDDFLRGRFTSLIELHKRNARSLEAVASVITKQNEQRADALEEQRRAIRNQGLEPLPNSREAQTARGRA